MFTYFFKNALNCFFKVARVLQKWKVISLKLKNRKRRSILGDASWLCKVCKKEINFLRNEENHTLEWGEGNGTDIIIFLIYDQSDVVTYNAIVWERKYRPPRPAPPAAPGAASGHPRRRCRRSRWAQTKTLG